MVSIHRPLSYEPNTLTTAPLRCPILLGKCEKAQIGYNFINKNESKIKRAHPGSNQGPADLQSAALPLSYIPDAFLFRDRKLIRFRKTPFTPPAGNKALPTGIEPVTLRLTAARSNH